MKVLLKSLKELKYEYGIEEIGGYLIIGSGVVGNRYFHPNLIKGEVINKETTYTIKRLSDGIEYDLYVVKL